ncbi:hypothetical protein [Hornefia butyriciproducens]|uniref:hypothetical protein n=1 Tax=Hornefia butyriciproducens TaxID=2652293 RepID=UPI003F888FFA
MLIDANYIKGATQKLGDRLAYIMEEGRWMEGRKISIDEKIERDKGEATKAKAKYDAAVDKLEKLMARKREMQQKELMTAFENSDKSYEEIMRFLNE